MKLLVVFLITFSCFSQSEIEHFNYFDAIYDSIGTHKVEYYLTRDIVERDRSLQTRAFRVFNGFNTSDYTNTGYDRGHLAPADAFSFDDSAYYDTYSLANVAPMKPSLNRQAWKYLEFYERRLVLVYKCINIEVTVQYGSKMIGKLTIPESFVKKISTCKGETIGTFRFNNL